MFEKQKQKFAETIKNNYSTTKNFKRPKYDWHIKPVIIQIIQVYS